MTQTWSPSFSSQPQPLLWAREERGVGSGGGSGTGPSVRAAWLPASSAGQSGRCAQGQVGLWAGSAGPGAHFRDFGLASAVESVVRASSGGGGGRRGAEASDPGRGGLASRRGQAWGGRRLHPGSKKGGVGNAATPSLGPVPRFGGRHEALGHPCAGEGWRSGGRWAGEGPGAGGWGGGPGPRMASPRAHGLSAAFQPFSQPLPEPGRRRPPGNVRGGGGGPLLRSCCHPRADLLLLPPDALRQRLQLPRDCPPRGTGSGRLCPPSRRPALWTRQLPRQCQRR